MLTQIASLLFSDVALAAAVFAAILLMAVLTWFFGREKIHRKQILTCWGILLLFLFLGFFYIRHTVDRTIEMQKEVLEGISRTCAETLMRNNVLHVSMNATEKGREYHRLCYLLEAWNDTNDYISSIYLLKKSKQGILRFHPAGETTDSSNHAQAEATSHWHFFMSENDLPQLMDAAFQGKSGFDKFVYHLDGDFDFMAVEPLFDEFGDVEAILCIEFLGADWHYSILLAKIWPHLFFFSFLLFFSMTQIFLIRRRRIAYKLRNIHVVDYEKTLEKQIAAKIAVELDAAEKNVIMAHVDSELKKPLLPVLESSFLLLRRIADRKSGITEKNDETSDQELMETIFRNDNGFRQILNDIRTFIDIEWRRLKIKPIPFSLQRMINEFRNDCQSRFWEKPGITIMVESIEPIPKEVIGDELKIRRIFDGVFDNAIGRMTEGHIKISCYVSDAQLCLSIVDTGNPPSVKTLRQLTSISAPPRWDEIRDEEAAEFDFGMYIAFSLTHAMKGDITIQSVSGRGNRCIVMIPVSIP